MREEEWREEKNPFLPLFLLFLFLTTSFWVEMKLFWGERVEEEEKSFSCV